VATSAEMLARVEIGVQVVGIDEIQFFDAGVVEVCMQLADAGIRVIAAGLDQDYMRRPFGPMPALLAWPRKSRRCTRSACAAAAPRTTRSACRAATRRWKWATRRTKRAAATASSRTTPPRGNAGGAVTIPQPVAGTRESPAHETPRCRSETLCLQPRPRPKWFAFLFLLLFSLSCGDAEGVAQDPVEREAEEAFVAYLRIDTTNPPGNETAGATYLRDLLVKAGSRRASWATIRSGRASTRGSARMRRGARKRCCSSATSTSFRLIRRCGAIHRSPESGRAGTSGAAARWTSSR
jgi:hypothetical protein